jgi:hypothetical protein
MKIFLIFLALSFGMGIYARDKSQGERMRIMLWICVAVAATYYFVSGTA